MPAGYCPTCDRSAFGPHARFCPRCGVARAHAGAVLLAAPLAIPAQLLTFIACHLAMASMALAALRFLGPDAGRAIAAFLGVSWLMGMVPASFQAIEELKRTASQVEIDGTIHYRRLFRFRSLGWDDLGAVVFSSRRTRGPRSRRVQITLPDSRVLVIDCTPAQEESIRRLAFAFGQAEKVSSR